ncbi:C2 domain protein, partial [Necator americanus]
TTTTTATVAHKPITSTGDSAVTSRATADAEPLRLPLSRPLGSTLESVIANPETDGDSSPRGLKRSPGMMITSDVFSGAKIHKVQPSDSKTTPRTEIPAVDAFSSELPNTFDELKSSYKWLREISEDDGSSAGQEMGRRKLPSIPSYSSYSAAPSYQVAPPSSATYTPPPITMPPQSMSPLAVQTDTLKRPSSSIRSQISPAPVYINASAPIPSTSSSYSIFGVSSTCTQTALPPEKLPNGHLPTDYSRPPSASSGTSLARSIDPAIIPGASFQTTAKPKTALRQPVSFIKTKPAHTPKIPNTLARVLLKKELKEALSRRREALEACEIEANQRQYIVHKMLVTGLLPEAREDDTPRVIPCLLPMELISGARVIPKPTVSVATQKSEFDSRFPITSSSSHLQYKPHFTSSTTAPSVAPVPATRLHSLPSTSLRAQLDAERKPHFKDFSLGAKSVETQTEQPSTAVDYAVCSRSKFSDRISQQRSRSNANVQTNDLLEATKKYFEDYDRQLNELTEKAKRAHRRQFEFHDDDPLSRETRRLQLMDELARRRERMFANMDLPSEKMPYRAYHSQLALDSSDYSSIVPHYGSLPRIDYPSRSRRSPLSRDFTVREPATSSYAYNYGSLPRNYERCLGQQFGPIQVDYEQSFGARPTAGAASRSMFNLHSDNIIDPRYRLPPGSIRSMNYLDQTGIDRTDPLAYATPYLQGRAYPSDTTNLSTSQPLGSQQGDMISRYATYLNNQFQTGLLSQVDPTRNLMSMPSTPAYRYELPPADPYMAPLPSLTLSEPAAAGPIPTYEAPQVYSRSENNYGARPPSYPLDYGNMYRQRLLRTTPPELPVDDPYAPMPTVAAPYVHTFPQQTASYYQPQYQLPSRSSYPPALSSNVPTGYVGKPAARTWSGNIVPSAYDARYPREDALSRMYATVGRRRPQAESHNRRNLYNIERRSDYPAKRVVEDSFRNRATQDVVPQDVPSSTIKRILLTRRYKDHNIYNDLGIRVVGGKRMPNGELGAFVSAVNQAKYNQILGEVKEGDQVLEWNGVLLNGKTFEEVERIVNSSSGEVEIILKSEGEKSHRISNPRGYTSISREPARFANPLPSSQKTLRIKDVSPDRAPPVPMHRRNGHNITLGRQNPSSRIYDNVDSLEYSEDAWSNKPQDALGYLQVAISYDRATSRVVVRIVAARGLKMRDHTRRLAPNPFVKIYLLPGRKVSNKRRTRFVPCSTDPEWNQIVEWQVLPGSLPSLYLEFTVWDYDRLTENNALGQVTVSLADHTLLSGQPCWLPLQPTDPRPVTHLLNAPLDNERPHIYHYNPGKCVHIIQLTNQRNCAPITASLDIGYPAIN